MDYKLNSFYLPPHYNWKALNVVLLHKVSVGRQEGHHGDSGQSMQQSDNWLSVERERIFHIFVKVNKSHRANVSSGI